MRVKKIATIVGLAINFYEVRADGKSFNYCRGFNILGAWDSFNVSHSFGAMLVRGIYVSLATFGFQLY